MPEIFLNLFSVHVYYEFVFVCVHDEADSISFQMFLAYKRNFEIVKQIFTDLIFI